MRKRILPILVLFAFLFAETKAQTTVTVNNTPGSAATYRTLQGALDSAAAGSVILLQPGLATYGQVTVKKLVSIFGAGYFPNQNPAPFTQANSAESVVDYINFDAGSNGSMISGITLNSDAQPYPNQRININNSSNITITRCFIGRQGGGTFISSKGASDIIFRQCYFFHSSGNNFTLSVNTSNNFQFYNCIFDGVGDNLGTSTDNTSTAVLFKNCTFKNYAGSVVNAIQNVTYINNVIFNTTTPGNLFSCAAASNNVGNVTYTSGSGNNITNAVPENTLVFATDPNIISRDGKLALKAGSPAIGYGQDGKDAGAYGGAEPYILSGIPIIPNIYLAETVGAATQSGNLKIRIKAKANQ